MVTGRNGAGWAVAMCFLLLRLPPRRNRLPSALDCRDALDDAEADLAVRGARQPAGVRSPELGLVRERAVVAERERAGLVQERLGVRELGRRQLARAPQVEQIRRRAHAVQVLAGLGVVPQGT